MKTIHVVAILSSALCIIPAGENEAEFSSRNLSFEEAQELLGNPKDCDDLGDRDEDTPHYVGHPDTAKAIEFAFCCEKANNPKFPGLQVGESFIATPLANNKREEGYTTHQAVTELGQLKFVLVTRIS